MKTNTTIATILLSLSFFLLSAQTATTEKVKYTKEFGFKAGISWSGTLVGASITRQADGKFGFTGGGFVIFPTSNVLGIQLETNYIHKGYSTGKLYQGHTYSSSPINTRIHSADLTMLFKVTFARCVSLILGPNYSITIAHKTDSISTYTAGDPNATTTTMPTVRNAFGGVIGIDGYIKNVVLSTRLGTDFYSKSTIPFGNRWLTFGVGYKFALGKNK